ncbi:hypothetical protein TUE45_pSRTUE45c_0332 (plasmid) [Streptomyces reticuli]|nr:hypothetical protein TUE45_pSRTUE45c_0332 [Streptomyces reticuli]
MSGYSSRRRMGEDLLLAVLLWLLDAIGTGVALLTGLVQTDFNRSSRTLTRQWRWLSRMRRDSQG